MKQWMLPQSKLSKYCDLRKIADFLGRVIPKISKFLDFMGELKDPCLIQHKPVIHSLKYLKWILNNFPRKSSQGFLWHKSYNPQGLQLQKEIGKKISWA